MQTDPKNFNVNLALLRHPRVQKHLMSCEIYNNVERDLRIFQLLKRREKEYALGTKKQQILILNGVKFQ
jgi:hypothetical protein